MKRGTKDAPTEDTRDELCFGPEIAPGVHSALRRSPDGEVRQVAVRVAEDGVPVNSGELAQLDDDSCECGQWRKITTIYKAGPAQVATPAYRKNYDGVFGKKRAVGEA